MKYTVSPSINLDLIFALAWIIARKDLENYSPVTSRMKHFVLHLRENIGQEDESDLIQFYRKYQKKELVSLVLNYEKFRAEEKLIFEIITRLKDNVEVLESWREIEDIYHEICSEFSKWIESSSIAFVLNEFFSSYKDCFLIQLIPTFFLPKAPQGRIVYADGSNINMIFGLPRWPLSARLSANPTWLRRGVIHYICNYIIDCELRKKENKDLLESLSSQGFNALLIRNYLARALQTAFFEENQNEAASQLRYKGHSYIDALIPKFKKNDKLSENVTKCLEILLQYSDIERVIHNLMPTTIEGFFELATHIDVFVSHSLKSDKLFMRKLKAILMQWSIGRKKTWSLSEEVFTDSKYIWLIISDTDITGTMKDQLTNVGINSTYTKAVISKIQAHKNKVFFIQCGPNELLLKIGRLPMTYSASQTLSTEECYLVW